MSISPLSGNVAVAVVGANAAGSSPSFLPTPIRCQNLDDDGTFFSSLYWTGPTPGGKTRKQSRLVVTLFRSCQTILVKFPKTCGRINDISSFNSVGLRKSTNVCIFHVWNNKSISESVASPIRPIRKIRFGWILTPRTDAKSRAFLILTNGMFRSRHNSLHRAKNSFSVWASCVLTNVVVVVDSSVDDGLEV